MILRFIPRTNKEQAEDYVRRRYGDSHFVEKLLADMTWEMHPNGVVRVELPNKDEAKRPLCACCGQNPGRSYIIEGWPEYTGSGDDMACWECSK